MTFDDLVRDTLREQAESSRPAPADLASRVLARRARRRTRGITVATFVAVVAVAAVVMPLTLHTGHAQDRTTRPARPDRHSGSPAVITPVSGIESHPSQSPPRDRIAAGDQVLAAYYSTRNVRQPGVTVSGHSLRFNTDGSLLTEHSMASPLLVFRRLDGTKVPAPAREKYEDPDGAPAGLSPDGTLLAGGFAGEGDKTATEVLNPITGKRAALQSGQKLLAWIDNSHLIAWDIPSGANEFGSRLVLVTVGGHTEVPLSGVRHATHEESPGRWDAVFARR